jgi:(S)-ureidoglycine aminohydrolase
MQNLGETRTSYQRDHALLTPDSFIRARLPGMKGATAIVHAAPATGAAFTQYTVEFESRGILGTTASQRFLYVLDGAVTIEIASKKQRLEKDGYAYLPQGAAHRVIASGPARAAVIEKSYQPLRGVKPPRAFIGDERAVAGKPLMGDDALEVRTLLPADPAFDMAVNTMTFEPGATLPMVECHVMEHGLLMLDGGGVYRLGERWYPVAAGDFIWMAPYCPQWFVAMGKTPASYIYYKNVNRTPI